MGLQEFPLSKGQRAGLVADDPEFRRVFAGFVRLDEEGSSESGWCMAANLLLLGLNVKIRPDDTKSVGRQKLKCFNFCRLTKVVSYDLILNKIASCKHPIY
jgi:hypothetical protein